MLTKNEYQAIHKWVSRHFTKRGICDNCQQQLKTEWSNKTGQYLRDRLDWQELCKPCHYKYDVEVLGKLTMAEIGRKGGAAPHKSFKRGFALNNERARLAGAKGGRISKRGAIMQP